MSTVTTQLNSGTTAIKVTEGGTGITSNTNYAPICAGTTATGILQSASTGLSSVGYCLTSNGSSALPSFQSPPGMSVLSMNLSTAQIQGMNATPIQVLAAQGTHTLIMIYFMKFEYIFNTTAFSGGGTVQLQYGNAVNASGCVICTGLDLTLSSSGLFYGAADQQQFLFGIGVVNPVSEIINQGIYITNGSAPFTGGGSSSGSLTVYYDVLSTTV